MKEDDTECEKRRDSAEKHKSVKDTRKKKEKKKNLEWQALEERRAKSRHEGEPEEESPDEDDSDDDDDDDDSEGMAAQLDRAVQGLPQIDVSSLRVGASKGPQGEPRDERQKEVSPRRPCSDTPPASAQGRAVPPSQHIPASGLGRRVKTSMTGSLTRGRAAAMASSQGGGHRWSASPDVRQAGSM